MWDTELFLWLNFDGGELMDNLMLFASGKLSWLPLYIVILALIWHRNGAKKGWKSMLLALLAIGLSVALSDIIAGVFKHTGLLKNLWASFPARLRPMYTEELQGVIHIIKSGGQYGTVSAHAATSVSIGLISTLAIRRRWFTYIMWCQVAVVCYSRIYLSYHFPQDILLGAAIGVISGYLMWRLFKLLNEKC